VAAVPEGAAVAAVPEGAAVAAVPEGAAGFNLYILVCVPLA
jgi:hypothetical protein